MQCVSRTKPVLLAAILGIALGTFGDAAKLAAEGASAPVAQEPAVADREQNTEARANASLPPNTVRQGFPAAKSDPKDLSKSDTAWEIEWELTHPDNKPYYPPGSTLRIKSAKFMWKDRLGKPQWIVVARMLELAEIYVPYDTGWMAFLDVHDMPFQITPARREFLGPPCVAPGEILQSSNPKWSGTVHKEVHDDGIRWMTAETSAGNQITDRARRGEKMLLWSTYYGANYRYLIEYGFGDDGMITCRLGPTGRNIFNRREDQQNTHLHIGCWRMEFDLGDPTAALGGPNQNELLLVRRVFDDATERFSQIARPFNKDYQGRACEGSARWNAEEFTTIRAQSKVRKNAHGKPVSFDVISQRIGALRQLQPEGGTYESNLDFINYDFWVTRSESGFTDYIDVPRYAAQKRPLDGHPTTVWLSTPRSPFSPRRGLRQHRRQKQLCRVGRRPLDEFLHQAARLFDSTPLFKPTPRSPQSR